jgi:hypothetical protein
MDKPLDGPMLEAEAVFIVDYSKLWEVMASAMAISKPAKMTPQKIARGKARMQASKVSTG